MSLPYDQFGTPRLVASQRRVLVTGGRGMFAIDPATRRVLWSRSGVRGFFVRAGRIFAWDSNRVTTLTLSGGVLWQRQICRSSEIVRDVVADESRVFVACVVRCCTPSRLIAVHLADGSPVYSLNQFHDAVASMDVLGPDLLVKENFSGAYSGEYEYFIAPGSGRLIAKFNTNDIVTTRNDRALLDDHLIFDVGWKGYKPALLSWFDLSSGRRSAPVTLAPVESAAVDPATGAPVYSTGPTFVVANWLYLQLGPTLY